MENKDIKNGMKVKINGEIEYLQDFNFCKDSFPQDIVFTVVRKTEMKRYELVADGYGLISPPNSYNHYGNGSIYVDEKWAKSFIKAGDMFWRGPEPDELCPACRGTGFKSNCAKVEQNKIIMTVKWDKAGIKSQLCPCDVRLALEKCYPHAKFEVGEFGKSHDVSDLYKEEKE